MNRQFKPLDRDRKYGIVLIILMLISFTIAYNAADQRLVASFMFVGVASFVTVLALMGKSIDENGGWDDPSAQEEAPPPPPRETADGYGPPVTWGNREFKPLDGPRKLGIVFFILTVAAFTAAYHLAAIAWLQGVLVAVGMLCFLTIFVLMDRSMYPRDRSKKGSPGGKDGKPGEGGDA